MTTFADYYYCLFSYSIQRDSAATVLRWSAKFLGAAKGR